MKKSAKAEELLISSLSASAAADGPNQTTCENEHGMRWTLLYMATAMQKEIFVELLLRYGADVNMRNIPAGTYHPEGHLTPLYAALICGNDSLIDLLLQYKADVNYASASASTTATTTAAAADEQKHRLVCGPLAYARSIPHIHKLLAAGAYVDYDVMLGGLSATPQPPITPDASLSFGSAPIALDEKEGSGRASASEALCSLPDEKEGMIKTESKDICSLRQRTCGSGETRRNVERYTIYSQRRNYPVFRGSLLGMCKEAKITFDVCYASEEKDSCGIIDATTLGQLIHHDFSWDFVYF